MINTQLQLMRYIRAAHNLAEVLRKNIIKSDKIDEKTMEALNKYVLTYNDIQDFVNVLEDKTNRLN